jgi:NADPH2:quinone reductase
VTRFRPGDRVYGTSMMGAFAENSIAKETSLRVLPEGVSFESGAAFGVSYGTAYSVLRSVADLRAGEWLCVLGAGGGVGLAAVDLGVALGARVVALASSEEKLELCLSRGAEGALNYSIGEFRQQLRDLTEGGVDVVVDPVGGPVSEESLRSMRRDGRFVTVGYASGEIPRIPLNLVLLKGIVIKGFEARTLREFLPELLARDRRELADLLATARVQPYVGAKFSLENTSDALRHIELRRAVGKVVIEGWRE